MTITKKQTSTIRTQLTERDSKAKCIALTAARLTIRKAQNVKIYKLKLNMLIKLLGSNCLHQHTVSGAASHNLML